MNLVLGNEEVSAARRDEICTTGMPVHGAALEAVVDSDEDLCLA